MSGTAELSNGEIEVRFEKVAPDFNDVINVDEPLRVVVTPSGPVSLYVSEKDQNHFVVKRFAGEADVEFDWIVTAYRKGYGPAEIEEEEVVEEGDEEEEESENVEEVEEVEEEGDIEDISTGGDIEDTSEDLSAPSDLPDLSEPADEVVEEVQEVQDVEEVEEEPASLESPELTQVDSASEDDGGEPAEIPLIDS